MVMGPLFGFARGVAITRQARMFKLRAVALIAALALVVPGGAKAFAASGPSTIALRTAGAAEVKDVLVRMPRSAPSTPLGRPMQVLVVLHGMAGNGYDFGNALASQADANNWIIVA